MAKFNWLLDTLLFYLLAAALAAVVGICFAQVAARYFLSSSFTWAEEVSIMILLWSVWGAACLAFRQDRHLKVKFFEYRLDEKKLIKLRICLNCVAIIFLATVTWASRTIIEGMAFMTLMSLPNVPANSFYYSVPVGCLMLVYYLLRSVIGDWSKIRSQVDKEC